MENNSKHPCDLCNHSDNCDINCVFYSYYSSYCSNYECIYHNSDIVCQYGKRCGSYIGYTPSELCFDDEEDEEEDF